LPIGIHKVIATTQKLGMASIFSSRALFPFCPKARRFGFFFGGRGHP